MADAPKKAVPPYATYQSFSNFINGLRENGCPKHITRSILPGSNSGKASMSATLSFLGLVNDKDEPTPSLRQLVDAKKDYGVELQRVIHASYPFFADKSLDLADTTTDKVMDKFKELGAGGSTVSKCVSFLLSAAKECGITVSRYVKTPLVVRSSAKKRQVRPSDPPPGDVAQNPGGAGSGGRVPTDKERIVVSVHGMEDWEILVPKGLSDTHWQRGLKMAKFILDNYREPGSGSSSTSEKKAEDEP